MLKVVIFLHNSQMRQDIDAVNQKVKFQNLELQCRLVVGFDVFWTRIIPLSRGRKVVSSFVYINGGCLSC